MVIAVPASRQQTSTHISNSLLFGLKWRDMWGYVTYSVMINLRHEVCCGMNQCTIIVVLFWPSLLVEWVHTANELSKKIFDIFCSKIRTHHWWWSLYHKNDVVASQVLLRISISRSLFPWTSNFKSSASMVEITNVRRKTTMKCVKPSTSTV